MLLFPIALLYLDIVLLLACLIFTVPLPMCLPALTEDTEAGKAKQLNQRHSL